MTVSRRDGRTSHRQSIVPQSTTSSAAETTANVFRRRRGRLQRSRHYALLATEGEICVPRLPPLGYRKQTRLIQQAQGGAQFARDTIWVHNARLAYSVINKYRSHPQLMADMFQEAQFALPRAIRRFDVSRLLEFSTYAFAAMRSKVTRQRSLHGCAARAPVGMIGPYHEFKRKVVEAGARSAWFDAREKYLARFPSLYSRLLRLHALTATDTLNAVKAVPGADLAPDSRVLAQDLGRDIEVALSRLDSRQRYVIDRRFGFKDRPIMTLEQIGAKQGLTRERVRQIQDGALLAIRAHLTERGWDTGLVPLQSLS